MKIKDLVPWTRHAGDQGGTEEHDEARKSLQREIGHLVDRFVEKLGNIEMPWQESEARSDVVQASDNVEISVELPGMEMEDIDLSISDDMLIVEGEKKIERQEEKQGYYLSERSYGQIYRAIPLPPGLDTNNATADLKNGVLTVRLPESAEAKSKIKKIAVSKS